VTLIGPKGRMENVAVLGPERSACQVELSKTDCIALGLDAPVRQSGDIENSPGLILANGGQLFSIRQGVIVAQRHIHMTPEEAAARGLKDKQLVRLETFTERPLIFEEVLLRVSPEYTTYAHLDYDEANACGFRKGDLGRILCTTN
jgi:propanediol utilization protein